MLWLPHPLEKKKSRTAQVCENYKSKEPWQAALVSYYLEIFGNGIVWKVLPLLKVLRQRKHSSGKGPCRVYVYAPIQLHLAFEFVTTTPLTVLLSLSLHTDTYVKTYVCIKRLSCCCHRSRIQHKETNTEFSNSISHPFAVLHQISINSEQITAH